MTKGRARLTMAAGLLLASVSRAADAPPGFALPGSWRPRPELCDLETALEQAAPTLRPAPLRAALSSWNALHGRAEVVRPVLSVIDYSLPSTAKRLWVFDLTTARLLFHELVAHGRESGEDLAWSFSNDEGSFKTSLGAFVTEEVYDGRNGYSLRLRGVELGVNDRAEARGIVVHGAPYVEEDVAQKLGRLGRSLGCPALRPAIARELIDAIKGGALLYAWYPSIDEAGAPVGSASFPLDSERIGCLREPPQLEELRPDPRMELLGEAGR